MPKVSAIIPTYNREAFVVKAVQSILKQRFTDYETIVVDDGSTDNTRKSLAPYWERITYIYQQNSGVSSALNAGIRVARGDWIAILGSDDEWMPDYLSHQVQRVVTYPRAVAHITNATMIDLNGTRKDHFADLGFLAAFGGRSSLMLQPFCAEMLCSMLVSLTKIYRLQKISTSFAGLRSGEASLSLALRWWKHIGVMRT